MSNLKFEKFEELKRMLKTVLFEIAIVDIPKNLKSNNPVKNLIPSHFPVFAGIKKNKNQFKINFRDQFQKFKSLKFEESTPNMEAIIAV